MKKENLKLAFDQVKPSEQEKERMFDSILDSEKRKKGSFMTLSMVRKAIPALALVVLLAGGLFTYQLLLGKDNSELPSQDDLVEEDFAEEDDLREDAVAPLVNQFRIEDKHYILLPDSLRKEYGLPNAVKEGDIGERITDITISSDNSLKGKGVYRYLPAGSEAVVAVKVDNNYQLFKFFTFENYNNNQDEDSVKYLTLHGITKAEDILKVQFIVHSEQSKLQNKTDIRAEITKQEEIAKFYSYYSVLKNSSDKYFDKLFNFNSVDGGGKDIETPIETPVDKPDSAPDHTSNANDLPLEISEATSANDMMDMGDTDSGSGSVEPSEGSAGEALSNPITIRIYNQSGIYYDSPYYVNMQFLSRYEVSDDFADFIANYYGK